MKNRKQSAVSRRLSGSDSEVVFQNLSNSISTISNILDNVSNQTNNNTNNLDQVNQTSQATQNLLQNQMDPNNAGSLIARIIDLENNPSGGGGIDPSDPDQPIIIVDNFIRQPNGDPRGTVTPYVFPSTETVVLNTYGSFAIESTDSETNHIGVMIGVNEALASIPKGLCLGRDEDAQLCVFTEVNHMYLVFKTPATLVHDIRIGFLDNHTSTPPNNGIYFERLIGEGTFFVVTRSTSTQTRTNTTIAYSANTWYVLKIKRTPTNGAEFTIDANAPITNTTNIPSSYLNPGCQIKGDGTNAADENFKFDFFSLKLGDDPIPVPGGTTIQGTTNEVEVTQVGSVITVGLPDEIAVDQVDFDPTIVDPILAEGELSWDSNYKTLVMGLVDNVQMQLGQSTYKRVRNQTGSQINKGTPVYVNGSHGQSLITVEPADASTEATAATTLGITAMDIPATSDGWVIVFGYLRGINTGSFSSGSDEGKTIWLSTTTGAMTVTRPTAPDHGVVLGTLVKSAGGGAGSMFVRVANGQELDELHDVFLNKSTIQNGDTIKWNSANNRFEQGPSGGSSNSVSTSVDFGSTYNEYSTEVVVTGQSWVTSGTKVVINPSVVQGHGHTVEDYLLEEIKCYVTSLNPGIGFTIQAYAPNSSFGIFDVTVSEL